jgi:hypothetical protein
MTLRALTSLSRWSRRQNSPHWRAALEARATRSAFCIIREFGAGAPEHKLPLVDNRDAKPGDDFLDIRRKPWSLDFSFTPLNFVPNAIDFMMNSGNRDLSVHMCDEARCSVRWPHLLTIDATSAVEWVRRQLPPERMCNTIGAPTTGWRTQFPTSVSMGTVFRVT